MDTGPERQGSRTAPEQLAHSGTEPRLKAERHTFRRPASTSRPPPPQPDRTPATDGSEWTGGSATA